MRHELTNENFYSGSLDLSLDLKGNSLEVKAIARLMIFGRDGICVTGERRVTLPKITLPALPGHLDAPARLMTRLNETPAGELHGVDDQLADWLMKTIARLLGP